MNALYNEIEPFAADWLERLVAESHIAGGAVDRRSIADLSPSDVAGPGQRHFFAGIGGWSYALRLAGVPDDVSVWTGSCPCQPFSSAGKGLGVRDPRHLWPAWFALIRECRPAIIFGEQVASRDGLAWLDLVFADLERCGYAVGAADLCAAGVGAPHIRQRLYFVAYADEAGRGELGKLRLREDRDASRRHDTNGCVKACGMADAHQGGCGTWQRNPSSRREQPESPRGGEESELADTVLAGRAQRRTRTGSGSTSGGGGAGGPAGVERDHRTSYPSATHPTWEICEWIPCRDPRYGIVFRPIEPGTFPLAHGVPARVGRLRGYGNAIVPQVAATFIRCALEAKGLV